MSSRTLEDPPILSDDRAGGWGTDVASRPRGHRTRMRGEKGYVLAMTALLLLPLLVFVSFAIDAGSWYAQASRMQRAADAAALAAVVWLPNTTNAANARNTVAAQNGYTSGVTGSMVSPTSYQVTITSNAPRFFSSTFDSNPYGLTRSAVAEFNKPVPLGSPTNKMGNDVAACPQFQPSQATGCGPQPMLWSSIQGPYEDFANGDPYTTKCGRSLTVSVAACSSGTYLRGATNELYRTTGYQFAIDVKPADVGRTMQFQVWDAGSYPRTVGSDSTTITASTRSVDKVTTTSGSKTVTRTTGGTLPFQSSDVGKRITGTGMPVGAYITAYTSATSVTINANATSSGTNRTLTVGQSGVDQVTVTNGSKNLTRSNGGAGFLASDVGRHVSGTGIAANTTITAVTNANTAQMSNNATGNGNNVTLMVSEAVTGVATFNGDCNQSQNPFNQSPYSASPPAAGTVGGQNCQTGDSGKAPFQLQIYENDGEDLTVDFSTTIPACHLYVPGENDTTAYNASVATYKNKWVTVCSFTPTQTGVYPVRVKSSAITLPNGTQIPDTSNGYNQFSMRVQGATTTRLYALDDMSIWTNTPSSNARFYLADIGPEHAGKRLQLDLYDPGDGNGGQYTMQVLAPPSGSPNAVPTTGTPIPVVGGGYADSCRYNSTASPTKGPNVTAPAGTAAPSCSVITRTSGGSNIYNNNWLRIEIKIADNYTCTTDCWWSIKYDFGGSAGIPTDRTVWSIKVVGDPVHLTD